MSNIQFSSSHREFTSTLNKRVNEYFKSRGITKYGTPEMFIKTVVMLLTYFVPYGLIVSNSVSNTWGLLGLLLVMSLGVSGIGLSVMHDANHGAYSKKRWINKLAGYTLNLVGANRFNWQIQHNVLHHSYTNVHEEDEDISPRGVIRMSPHSKWKCLHKFQHIYAWVLYGLMTIVWIFIKDFSRIVRYQKNGMAKRNKANLLREWYILIFTKLVVVGYIFVIPWLVTPLLWWQVILGILIMHYIAGFVLAIIFQPAHVMEHAEFPLPDEHNVLSETWAVHQLRTTANFGNRSKWFTWYVGGLNFQIEHHLFPHVCHVHYRRISKIVRSTAHEFGLPYHSSRTFLGALGSHFRLLKKLGMKPT